MTSMQRNHPEEILWFVSNGRMSPKQGRSLVLLVIGGYFLLIGALSVVNKSLNAYSLLIFVIVVLVTLIFGLAELYRWFPVVIFLAIYDILGAIQRIVSVEPNMSMLYYLEKNTFGIFFNNRPPSYYFYENHLAFFDVVFGVFYVIHIIFPPIMAFYLRIVHEDKFDQLAWSMLFLGIFGSIFYIFFPTASPWYTYNYGFDASKVSTITQKTATAGLWYTDEVLGINFFSKIMWELTAAKFAAFPSMHVGAPAYIYFSFKKIKLKNPSRVMLIYIVIIFASVVYLNHHWVWDAIGGLFFAWLSVKLAGLLILDRSP